MGARQAANGNQCPWLDREWEEASKGGQERQKAARNVRRRPGTSEVGQERPQAARNVRSISRLQLNQSGHQDHAESGPFSTENKLWLEQFWNGFPKPKINYTHAKWVDNN